MSNNKKIIKVSLIKNNEPNFQNEITENSNESSNENNKNDGNYKNGVNDKNNSDYNININIHSNLNNYLLKDINYIKSTTIKEILKTLKLDGDTFKKLEYHLNKEIKIN